jgi:hypothetical protein
MRAIQMALIAGLLACLPLPLSAQTKLTGVLQDVEVVPNVPGARCGNHLGLKVLVDGKVRLLKLYDPKVSSSDMKSFLRKPIELELEADTVVQSIRLPGADAQVAALAGLSTRKPC